jgi:hypothetical protein
LRVILGKPHQDADPPHLLGLLRVRRERPCCRAAEQGDEAAPFQLIEFRQVAPFGKLAAYRRAVIKSGLVQCRISVGQPSVVGQKPNATRVPLCLLPPAADMPLECAPEAGQVEVSDLTG